MGEGEKDRFFFVANNDPQNSETIFLVTATTKIESRLKRHGARAGLVVVIVTRADYAELTEDSAVDCDCPIIKRPRAKFEAQARAKEYQPLPRLPEEIISKIHAAIASARTLSANDKRLILGPEPDGDGNCKA
jgi:hypothetical protein